MPTEHAWAVQHLACTARNIVRLQARVDAAHDLVEDSGTSISTLVITPRLLGGCDGALQPGRSATHHSHRHVRRLRTERQDLRGLGR